MAKQIKAIKCPQCGSSKHTQLENEHYKCENCGTEYFLDNDDINVNIKHTNKKPTIPTQYSIIGIICIIVFIFLFSICRDHRKQSVRSIPSGTQTSQKVEKPKGQEILYKFLFQKIPLVFEIDNGNKVALQLVNKKERESSENILTYLSLDTGKEINSIKLPIDIIETKEFRKMDDDNIYVIINKKYIYKINYRDLDIRDVTNELFQNCKELNDGIAKVEFMNIDNGGMEILSNMGKGYKYFPIPQKIYTKDQYYNADKADSKTLPGAKNVTYYDFSKKSDDFPDESIQLLQITYKYNAGGPEYTPSAKWFKDYVHYGFIDDTTPYKKRLFNGYLFRVTSYKDITPGEIYFSPLVQYYDDDIVIIKYKPNIGEDTPFLMKCISLKDSAKVLWSRALEKDEKEMAQLIKVSNGFLAVTNSKEVILLDNEGKRIKKYTLGDS